VPIPAHAGGGRTPPETSTLRRPLLRRPVAGARPGEEAGRLAGVSGSDSTLNERADIVEEAPTVGLQIIRDEVAGRGSRRFGSVASGSTIWANHFRPHSLVDSVDKPLLGILGRHGTVRTGLRAASKQLYAAAKGMNRGTRSNRPQRARRKRLASATQADRFPPRRPSSSYPHARARRSLNQRSPPPPPPTPRPLRDSIATTAASAFCRPSPQITTLGVDSLRPRSSGHH